MAKYTKKQIERAFYNWEKQNRLYPSKFESEEYAKKFDLNEIAKDKADWLIKFMDDDFEL